MIKTPKKELAKRYYIDENKSITDICVLVGRSRTTVHNYKNDDLENGIDWDELRLLKATDANGAKRTEAEFVALLIHSFETALKGLDTAQPEKQIVTVSKYINTYYKIKNQRDNPKVNAANVAKEILQHISKIALENKAVCVIEFLANNSDQIVSQIIKK